MAPGSVHAPRPVAVPPSATLALGTLRSELACERNVPDGEPPVNSLPHRAGRSTQPRTLICRLARQSAEYQGKRTSPSNWLPLYADAVLPSTKIVAGTGRVRERSEPPRRCVRALPNDTLYRKPLARSSRPAAISTMLMKRMTFSKRFCVGEGVSEGFRNDLPVVFARSALRSSGSFRPGIVEESAREGATWRV